jgi:hypothetical protein
MKTYIVVTKDGRTKHISAYTYSEAFQVASEFAGDSLILSFDEV